MFELDPKNIVNRVKVAGLLPPVPSLGESVLRGAIGFTLVSLGGFAPWVFAGGWFHRTIGEAGMYAACAIVFIGLSGLLLHRLIIGPGSVARFYKIFSLAFLAYAIAWTVGWMALRGDVGSIIGLLAGTAAMGAILAHAFTARGAALKIIAVLFVANTIGYFVGGWAHDAVLALKEGNGLGIVLDRPTRAMVSRAVWGLFYGLGFGAGIGFAFHACQAERRRMLKG